MCGIVLGFELLLEDGCDNNAYATLDVWLYKKYNNKWGYSK